LFRPDTMQKPQKLRQMLEQHAEIGRIYLALEGRQAVLAGASLFSARAALQAGFMAALRRRIEVV
jgi:hypothetical protein